MALAGQGVGQEDDVRRRGVQIHGAPGLSADSLGPGHQGRIRRGRRRNLEAAHKVLGASVEHLPQAIGPNVQVLVGEVAGRRLADLDARDQARTLSGVGASSLAGRSGRFLKIGGGAIGILSLGSGLELGEMVFTMTSWARKV